MPRDAFARNTGPRWRVQAYVPTSVIIGGLATFALSNSDSLRRTVFAALAAALSILVAPVIIRAEQFSRGILAVRLGKSVVFSQAAWVRLTWVAAALVFSVVGAGVVLSWVAPENSPIGLHGHRANVSMLVLTIGVAALFPIIASVRAVRPQKLEIDPQGILFRSGLIDQRLVWTELASSHVVFTGRFATGIGLKSVNDGVRRFSALDLDSDPAIVVGIIEYFRTHSDERHKTRDPMTALAAFADTVV